MEAKNIGRVLTGGLIATELLGVLVEKEILTDVDVCRLLMKARKAIERTAKGQSPLVLSLQEKAAATPSVLF